MLSHSSDGDHLHGRVGPTHAQVPDQLIGARATLQDAAYRASAHRQYVRLIREARIDRDFGHWTPFLEVGVANSIPDTFVYRRPFASYGELGHFQAGVAYHFVNWLSAAASAFDVAPWGSQTTDSRVLGNGSGGSAGHGPPFLQGHQTTGGSSLAADNGFSAGLGLSLSKAIDLTIGYSRSTHYDLNTISFGIEVNMRAILRHSGL